MGAIFTILTIRGALLVMAIVSSSVLAIGVISSNQAAFDPFAPYVDILPGQSRDAVSRRGFECQFNLTPSLEEYCLLTPENAIFSSVIVWIAQDMGQVRRVIFRPRGTTLTLGDLMLLWGRPEVAIYDQTVNFWWLNTYITAIPQRYRGHLSYWLPISYVAFESDYELAPIQWRKS